MGGFEDEDIWWEGTRREYKRWIAYKREWALTFMKRGLSVGWYPEEGDCKVVFVPARPDVDEVGCLATFMFYGRPMKHSIKEGDRSIDCLASHKRSKCT